LTSVSRAYQELIYDHHYHHSLLRHSEQCVLNLNMQHTDIFYNCSFSAFKLLRHLSG